MNKKQTTKFSKFLSLVLRHRPDVIGITLDEAGWVPVQDLLRACAQYGRHYTLEQLQRVVDINDKQRFCFSQDGRDIRANQGHSVDIQLGLAPLEPPCYLWHGTCTRFLDSIYRDGLTRQSRQHVHLSPDAETARQVGRRHGKLVLFRCAALLMYQQGHEFYLSANGVWLTDHVPTTYLEIPAWSETE